MVLAQVDKKLSQLIAETCSQPSGSLKRQLGLTKLIRLIQQSKKLWRENTPYYQDALQQTWMYFSQNLCEGITGKKYDSERSSVMTWLNRYLRWRLQDFRAEQAQKLKRTASKISGLDKTIDPVDNLVASPDIPPILENVRKWVESDPDGELRRLHIKGYPHVTCQRLILRRLPPETSWKELAAEFDLSVSTLSSFYQRKCLPCLRKFGQSEGYID